MRRVGIRVVVLAVNGPATPFAQAVAADLKGKVSLVLYVCAIGFAFFLPLVSDVIFVVVAVIWFIPDRRFERVITGRESLIDRTR